MGMIEELFWGLKFSIPGILGGGKIWQVFFGQLDLSWDIFGYTKQSEDLISNVVIFHAFWKFLGLGNSAWDFLGGFGEIPILIYAPIRSSQDPMHPTAPRGNFGSSVMWSPG